MTAVKWAFAVVAAMLSLSAAPWLRDRQKLRLHLWTLAGLLPFFPYHEISLIFFGTRPGDTHGFELSLLDWVAFSLLVAAKPSKRPLPYRFALGLYFLVVIVSIPQGRWALHAAGYAWKLGRMYLLTLSIWRAGGEDERVPGALLRGMMIGVVYEGVLVTWQHFGLGLHQATGSFVHQNTLGMLVNLVVMVPIARILAGPTSLLTKLAAGAAVIIALFAVSRGTLLFLGLGAVAVCVGSLVREVTRRKTWFAFLGLVLISVIVPVALTTVESRTAEERAQSMEARVQLADAAAMMFHDHPLGVGPNHYSVELMLGGYGERVGLGWSMRLAIVHNVYWLTMSELGYAGIVALVILFLAPLRLAFSRGGWRCRGGRGDILLGLGVGVATVYLHSSFEWAWRQAELSYAYFAIIAMIAVLARPGRAIARATSLPAPAVAPPRAVTNRTVRAGVQVAR